ncbi:MAG: HRDC domain-containing protein [Verrucomicrobia bacterium]|nr:HRDC domain-containing protein [Verrucomicrobiota bacterium]MBU4292380.1 HRDC domain-containing protein [Verrucomicrobiota bacterium]MBU4428217.1 HRDC domain-containing protein [Verrucomicrobiota bacterium]MBU4496698.1 HRDC domain-containing protein [Verrucomicrobiota bacterium]MCG2679116.1 HRDC domain-containing protein [Kiritimatiellia bacterium]
MDSSVHYTLIDRPDALRVALADLAPVTSLALDLEMENSYRRYGLHIALIQVSTPERKNYIFDPLSSIDIRLLGALLTHRNTELIVHDADFDRRACFQVYRWTLNHLFDTKIAAQLCGFRQFGLGSLLKELLNIHVDKKFQTFDWLKRPIRKDALDYAARDTASLHELKAILTRRLTELGRLAWAREEFIRLETIAPAEPAEPMHYRIKKSSLLSPRQLTILRSLTVFRDQVARRLNRPVHYIMRDPILLQLAAHPPAGENALRSIRGLHPVMYRTETIRQLMQAVAQGQAAPEELHPLRKKRPPIKAGYSQRLKTMQDWRRQIAAPLDLEPYLLLSNDILQWCARNPGAPLPAPIASQLRHWQKELLWNEFQRKFIAPQ